MNKKSSYNYEELIDCANGKLFGPGNAKLPLPPMLMFDRITEIRENKVHGKPIDIFALGETFNRMLPSNVTGYSLNEKKSISQIFCYSSLWNNP